MSQLVHCCSRNADVPGGFLPSFAPAKSGPKTKERGISPRQDDLSLGSPVSPGCRSGSESPKARGGHCCPLWMGGWRGLGDGNPGDLVDLWLPTAGAELGNRVLVITQNPSMVSVGRDLCGSPSPTLLLKQGHLQQAAQHRVQAGLEYLQRRRLHNLPGQPVPGLRHP